MVAAVSLSLLGLPGAASAAGLVNGAIVKVLGWGLDEPAGLAVDGQKVFVTNAGNNSVTELALPKMTLVRVLQGDQFQFSLPRAVAVYGPDLWVLSDRLETTGSSWVEGVLTEVDATTGHVVRVVTGARYGMNVALAMTIDGPDIFVVDEGKNQVTEVDASSGQLVRVLNAGDYIFAEPHAITSIGPDVFVANDQGGAGGTVTEFVAATGALVQVIGGVQYKFSEPTMLASYGPNLFVFSAGAAQGRPMGR